MALTSAFPLGVHRKTQLLREGAHPLIERHDREQIVEVGPEVHRRGEMDGIEGTAIGEFGRRADESRSEDSSHSRVTLRSTLCSSRPERMMLESK